MSGSFEKVSDVASFAHSTYSPLFQLQAALVNQDTSSQLPKELFDSAALSVAMSNLIITVPFHHAQGKTSIPQEISRMHSNETLPPSALSFQQSSPHTTQAPDMAEAIQDMAEVANEGLAHFYGAWNSADPRTRRAMVCAFLQVVSVFFRIHNACKHLLTSLSRLAPSCI